jgi:hypothetical protein
MDWNGMKIADEWGDAKPTSGGFSWSSGDQVYEDLRSDADDAYEKEVAERASLAKSEEAISAQRALAESAVKALTENKEVVAFLNDGKKRKPSGIIDAAMYTFSPYEFILIGEARKPKDVEGVEFQEEAGELGETITTFASDDFIDQTKMSGVFIDSKCSATVVPVDYDFSLGPDALKAAVDYAQKVAEETMEVHPIIARVPVIDPLQLAHAALAGASAVMISLSIAGEEKIRELMTAAVNLGLDPLIRVTSADQLATALEVGAKRIVFGDMTLPEAKALKQSIPANVITVADLTFQDVRYGRLIKNAGLGVMIADGESLIKASIKEGRPPGDIVQAILSKNASPDGFYGLGQPLFAEGALVQEGDLWGKRETRGMEDDLSQENIEQQGAKY